MRFSRAETGPASGSYLRGADNRAALRAVLDYSDEQIDELEGSQVLCCEHPAG
jgi:crotonobetainyl-CoA:carnitine CoA-transferase CaiB-like acyl-CoA transferase